MLIHRFLWVISLLLSTLFFLPNMSFSAQEQRLALLIGNSHYTHGGSLDNPVNDVRAIKTALESEKRGTFEKRAEKREKRGTFVRL